MKAAFSAWVWNLEGSHEGGLLGVGLESSVTELGGGVDKLEINDLKSPLLGSNATSLDHQEVLLDLSVMREASHGVDRLVGQIIVSGGVILDELAVLHLVTLSDSVDLLVDLSSVMVTLLTSSGHSVLDSAGMPCSNTSDLSQTLVGLPGQLLGVPPGGDALKSVTLGDTNNVHHLVLGEHGGDGDLLLKVISGEGDLVSDGASVELDLHDVGLLLPPSEDLHLGVADDTDDSAVLLHLSQILLNLLLSQVISPLGAGLGEGLLLGLRPVLVEAPLGLLADVLGPDSLESPHASGGLDVANNTNADHWGSLEDGDSLHHLLL